MTLVERIERSFEEVRKPAVHPASRNKKPKRIMPLLPDTQLYGNNFVHVAFEENPLQRGSGERAKRIPEVCLLIRFLFLFLFLARGWGKTRGCLLAVCVVEVMLCVRGSPHVCGVIVSVCERRSGLRRRF